MSVPIAIFVVVVSPTTASAGASSVDCGRHSSTERVVVIIKTERLGMTVAAATTLLIIPSLFGRSRGVQSRPKRYGTECGLGRHCR